MHKGDIIIRKLLLLWINDKMRNLQRTEVIPTLDLNFHLHLNALHISELG